MKLEDLDKETLVRIIEGVFVQLEQKYLCYPDMARGSECNLNVWQPNNALVNVIYDSENPINPSKEQLNYKPLSTMAIEYLEEAGCKIIWPDKK